MSVFRGLQADAEARKSDGPQANGARQIEKSLRVLRQGHAQGEFVPAQENLQEKQEEQKEIDVSSLRLRKLASRGRRRLGRVRLRRRRLLRCLQHGSSAQQSQVQRSQKAGFVPG